MTARSVGLLLVRNVEEKGGRDHEIPSLSQSESSFTRYTNARNRRGVYHLHVCLLTCTKRGFVAGVVWKPHGNMVRSKWSVPSLWFVKFTSSSGTKLPTLPSLVPSVMCADLVEPVGILRVYNMNVLQQPVSQSVSQPAARLTLASK